MLHLISDDPRYRGHVALSLDGRAPVRGQVATSLSRLNLAPATSLGHAPALPHLPGLQGCVRGLVVSMYISTLSISTYLPYLCIYSNEFRGLGAMCGPVSGQRVNKYTAGS